MSVLPSLLPHLDAFLQISSLNAGLFSRPFAGFHCFRSSWCPILIWCLHLIGHGPCLISAFTPAETLRTTIDAIWLCNPKNGICNSIHLQTCGSAPWCDARSWMRENTVELLFSARIVPGTELSGTPTNYGARWRLADCNVPEQLKKVRLSETAVACSSHIL